MTTDLNLTLTLDGRPLPFQHGDSLMQAAERDGRPIPHLCWHGDLPAHGSCRLCVVRVTGGDGRPRLLAACSTQAMAGLVVESEVPDLQARRLAILQMLFVEGNHFCPSCEKSGACGLQSAAYAAGMTGPHWEEFYPRRAVDASHPDLLLDRNRCILCGLCVRASEQLDHKGVFAIAGQGLGSHLVVDSPTGQLGDSRLELEDRAARICPVGALLPKRVGFAVPIGERAHDLAARAIEAAATAQGEGA